jgi:cell division transport system permease protein
MNIRRNKLFSIASIGTIAACVFLLGIFYAIVTNFNHIVNQAEDQVAVTVFFDSGITEEQITEIGDQIKENDAVGEIVYTSAEEAWETFSKEYFKGHEDLAEGYKDDNPLANSASYTVYLTDIDKQAKVVSCIQEIEGVRDVNYSESTAETLSDFGRLAGYISAGIIII